MQPSSKQISIAEKLQKLIENSTYSANQICRQTGIPNTTMYMILRGEVVAPNANTLKILADFFDVSVDFLLDREKYQISHSFDPGSRANLKIQSIPVIKARQINKWIKEGDKSLNAENHDWVHYSKNSSPKTFALKIDKAQSSDKFPKDAILIVDATQKVVNKDYVVASQDDHEPAIWQVTELNKIRYLNPVGLNIPGIELDSRVTIHGKIVESRQFF